MGGQALAAYRRWRELADRGYGERCDTPAAMKRVDDRIRRAKERYERLADSTPAGGGNHERKHEPSADERDV